MESLKKIGPTTKTIIESIIDEINKAENQNKITHPIKRELTLPFGIIVAILVATLILVSINLYYTIILIPKQYI